MFISPKATEAVAGFLMSQRQWSRCACKQFTQRSISVSTVPSASWCLLMPFLDPTVYPYLTIYPAVTGVSKPVHPTPVPCASNIVESTGVQSKLGYPSLVICKSPNGERRPEPGNIDFPQIPRYTHGLMFILLLPVGSPDPHHKPLFANHGSGWRHILVQNYGSDSQLTRTHPLSQGCRIT